MKLELHKVKVRDVQWGDATCVKDGVLYVNKAEAIACVSEEKRFAKVDLELARPGERPTLLQVMASTSFFPSSRKKLYKAG